MVSFYGDFDLTETVNIPFNTFSSDNPSVSVTITDLVAGDVYVHQDGVEGTPTGITVSLNVGTVNGNHLAILDLSDTNDAGFYAVGSRYQVRMEGVTIDGATVNAWIGSFSIGCTLRPATAGRTIAVEADGVAHADVKEWLGTAAGSAISAANLAKLEDILDGTGGTGLALDSIVITGAATGISVTGTTAGVSISGGTTGIGLDINGGSSSGVAVDVDTASGAAIDILAGGGNGIGLAIAGNGSGAGMQVTAGITGNGVHAIGGATSGSGIYATGPTLGHGMSLVGIGTSMRGLHAEGYSGIYGKSTATNGMGIMGLGAGTNGAGIFGRDDDGDGIKGYTDHVDGVGIHGEANNGTGFKAFSGNDAAMIISGEDYGVDILATAGPAVRAGGTTFGAELTASAGPGLSATSTGGNGDGIIATANGSGLDFNAATTDGLQVDTVELASSTQRATDLAEIAQYLIANSAEPITDYVADESLLAKLLAADGDISAYDDQTDSQEALAVTLASTATAAKLLAYVQLICRSDDAIETDNATELTAINADGGSGAGDYSNETDGLEGLRDRGDTAWVTGGGGGATASYTTTNWTRTIGDNDGGAGSDTASVNGTTFDTGETAAGTYLEVDAIFTIGSGETGLTLDFWGFYDGGGAHYVTVQAKDTTTALYEPIGTIGLGSDVQHQRFELAPGHTDGTTVTCKFLHGGGSGNANHVFSVDKCQVNSIAPVTSDGSGLTSIPWNASWDTEVESECNDALVALNLDHLCKTVTAAADMTTEVADNTILSRILANGDTSAFVPSTDGLQPVRDEMVSEHAALPTAAEIYTAFGTGGNLTTCATATGFAVPGDLMGLANGSITAAKIGADAITNAKIADDAIAPENLATGALTADAFAANALAAGTFAAASLNGKGDWNTTVPDAAGTAATPANVLTQVTAGLVAINLDHLMFEPVAANSNMTTEVKDGTVLSNIMSKTSDTSTFTVADDSLEGIADGGGGGGATAAQVWTYAERVLTANTNLNDLDAAGVRTAVGLASANLDTQLAAVKAETALIVADTNELQTDDVPGLIAALNDFDPANDTVAAVTTVGSVVAKTGYALTAGERTSIADAVLVRSASNVEATAGEHSLCYVILAMSEANTTANAGKLTVFRTDGSTEFAQKTLATDASADPATGVS